MLREVIKILLRWRAMRYLLSQAYLYVLFQVRFFLKAEIQGMDGRCPILLVTRYVGSKHIYHLVCLQFFGAEGTEIYVELWVIGPFLSDSYYSESTS